jgi:hypothetical protein
LLPFFLSSVMLCSVVTAWPVAAATAAPAAPLTTHAERTAFAETGRYAEVLDLCTRLAANHPARLACVEVGRTPEGRRMMGLVASNDGLLDPAANRKADRPVLLVIGGIHAGEIDGKDAGLALLRDLAAAAPAPGLGAMTVVFVPVFNVDGHERFGPNQRPNQRGPRQTGFRTTAQNLNLNRDWVKADAPEMAAMLALITTWDPVMLVDLHVTDGAKFQHDVAVMVAPERSVSPQLQETARALSDQLMAGLTRRGHLPLPFYPHFRKDGDPTSGIDVGAAPPRMSHGYAGWRNRLGILVETHSWRDYPHRVKSTRAVLEELLQLAPEQAPRWKAAARAADRATIALAGTPVVLRWRAEGPPRPIDFRGYAVTREPSPVSGGTWIRFDERTPQIWKVDLFERLAPVVTVTAPRAGYVIPAALVPHVQSRLQLHGLKSEPIASDRTAAAQVFRADKVKLAATSYEGRVGAELTGSWHNERRTIPAGSLFVPIAQPGAPLLLQLLEPASPDSLAAWGFFHAAFEQKEYMEDYIAEEQARAMLARDPKLKAQFEAQLAGDPAFAKDPRARLKFFYRRHPAWDERVNLYPILRLDRRP